MMLFLITTVFFLAFFNGSNDNFKGVATLRRSRYFTFRRAVTWAAIWTFAGSAAGALAAKKLVSIFSGAALIPSGTDLSAALTGVAAGAALTVAAATLLGMPISTTHALAGALTGITLMTGGWQRGPIETLLGAVFLPLLLSPLLAVSLTRLSFPLLRRVFPAEPKCLCMGNLEPAPALLSPDAVGISMKSFLKSSLPALAVGTPEVCAVHFPDGSLRADLSRIYEGVHWLSGGLISFSRGMNDTPKIAALLLSAAAAEPMGQAFAGVAVAMALGGMAAYQRVAKTISEEITEIPSREGTGANLATAALVGLASSLGLAVSTTHVSIGSILGIGLARKDSTNWRTVAEIVLAWVVTLPLGFILGCVTYMLLS